MHVDQVTDLHRVKSRLLEQCDRFWFATNRYQWGGIKCLHFLFTACGRRRMSPSARHKLALCERNPGFPGRKLIFPHRRSRRGNVIISFRGKEGRKGEEGSSWLGSTGYQLIQQLFRRRKLLVVRGRVLRCAIFSEEDRENERWKLFEVSMKSERQDRQKKTVKVW